MAASETGDYKVTVANIGAAAVTVAKAGSDTIDGAATSIVLQQYSAVTLKVNAATDGYNTIAERRGITASNAELNIMDGVTSTTAEINILDGVTSTAAELNIMDAGTTVSTPVVAGGDAFVMDDIDVGMAQVDIDNVDTYLAQTTVPLTNKTLTSPVLNTGVSGTAVLDEDDLTSDSATQIATQQSIKAYVDATASSSGSWTPGVQDSSFSDAESQTYNVQVGSYTKVGNRVFYHGSLDVSSLGTLTAGDPVYISGLPFSSNSSASNRGSMHPGSGFNFNITAGQTVSGINIQSSTVVALQLWDSTFGTTAMLVSEFSTDGQINFAGQYIV